MKPKLALSLLALSLLATAVVRGLEFDILLVNGPIPPVIEGGYSGLQLTPDGNTLLFEADIDGDVEVLHAVPLDGSSPPVRLSPPLVGVSTTRTSPDGAYAVFEARFTDTLYAARTDGSQPATLLAVGTTPFYSVTPDSTRVIYIPNGFGEMFSIPIDGSAPPTLVAVGVTNEFPVTYALSQDSTRVVYRSDDELRSAPLAGGPSTFLGTIADRGRFAISPDSQRVIYAADGPVAEELLSIPIDGSQPAITVTPASMFNVPSTFEITSDSTRVVYRVNVGMGNEIFSSPLDGSAPATRLSGPPSSHDIIDPDIELSPDGSRVLFIADEVWNVAPVDGSQLPVAVVTTDAVVQFTSDSAHIVYARFDNSQGALNSVPADGSGSEVLLLPTPPPGGEVDPYFRLSQGGTHAVTIASNESLGSVLVSVRVDGSTAPVVLDSCDGNLPSGTFRPGASRVAYGCLDDFFRFTILESKPLNSPSGEVDLGVPLLEGAPRSVHDFFVSPTGTHIAYGAGYYGAVPQQYFVRSADGTGPTLSIGNNTVALDDVGFSADGTYLVYYTSTYSADRFALYLLPVDGQTDPIRLDYDPFGLDEFALDDDASHIVWRGGNRLWSAPVSGGATTQVSLGNIPVTGFVANPGSTEVAYTVQSGNSAELRVVPFDASQDPVLLALTPGTLALPTYTPDGQLVVYRRATELEGDVLFAVPADDSAPPLQITELDATHQITALTVTPDSSGVVFQGTLNQPGLQELYHVPVDGSADPLVLSDIQHPLGDVERFELAPDGTFALYSADQDVNGDVQLYRVPTTGGPTLRLSDPQLHGSIEEWKRGNTHVAYRTQDALFVAALDGSGTRQIWNMAPSDFQITPSGKGLVFQTEDIYRVSLAGGAPVRVNETPSGAALLEGFEVGPEGVYHRIRENGVRELFVSKPRRTVTTNDAPAGGGTLVAPGH